MGIEPNTEGQSARAKLKMSRPLVLPLFLSVFQKNCVLFWCKIKFNDLLVRKSATKAATLKTTKAAGQQPYDSGQKQLFVCWLKGFVRDFGITTKTKRRE